MNDLNPCPLCGALPCDWVDDPHKAEVGLCWTLAKIREVLGVGEKPMLGELPDIIAATLTAQAAEIARLKEALGYISNLEGEINPSNYDHDDACDLNRSFCEAITTAHAVLTGSRP